MINKAFLKNVIVFSVIVGGALLALYVFDIYQSHTGGTTSEETISSS